MIDKGSCADLSIIFNIFHYCVIAIARQLPPSRIYERFTLLFFSLIFIMLGNQQAIPGIFEDRSVYFKFISHSYMYLICLVLMLDHAH
jgi:hypothetical protein